MSQGDGKKLDARRRRPLSGAGCCAQKREREKTASLLKSARSQKGDDGLKSPEFSEETKKKLERSKNVYKKTNKK